MTNYAPIVLQSTLIFLITIRWHNISFFCCCASKIFVWDSNNPNIYNNNQYHHKFVCVTLLIEWMLQAIRLLRSMKSLFSFYHTLHVVRIRIRVIFNSVCSDFVYCKRESWHGRSIYEFWYTYNACVFLVHSEIGWGQLRHLFSSRNYSFFVFFFSNLLFIGAYCVVWSAHESPAPSKFYRFGNDASFHICHNHAKLPFTQCVCMRWLCYPSFY